MAYKLPLPRGWKRRVPWSVLHIVALSRTVSPRSRPGRPLPEVGTTLRRTWNPVEKLRGPKLLRE